MSLDLINSSQKSNKTPSSFFSKKTRKVFQEMVTNYRSSGFRSSRNKPSNNKMLEVENHFGINASSVTMSNTMSEMNLSNVFETNLALVKASSFVWPEVKMSTNFCDGHECLDDCKDINSKILYQPMKQRLKPGFTPPMFSKTGILSCPDVDLEKYMQLSSDVRKHSSVLEDDDDYLIPGNMEFIEFTYPNIRHKFRYSTFAVPNSRFEWEWIYKHIDNIRNSFRRKYHCEVMLASEPGNFKGKIAYLVRIEGDSQCNILRCRSGLPAILAGLLVIPFNAINDVNCYVTEYLIKRKYIFQKISDQHDSVTTD